MSDRTGQRMRPMILSRGCEARLTKGLTASALLTISHPVSASIPMIQRIQGENLCTKRSRIRSTSRTLSQTPFFSPVAHSFPCSLSPRHHYLLYTMELQYSFSTDIKTSVRREKQQHQQTADRNNKSWGSDCCVCRPM